MKEKIALRIDDFFSSAKKYEACGKETVSICGKTISISSLSNFLFMKYLPGIRRRPRCPEMKVPELESLFEIIERNNARVTVGVTASWVEKNGGLVPFFEKFPEQAKFLKEKSQSGIAEIANHGLTHCVVGKHLPHLFRQNRTFHREFWEWVPVHVHKEHVNKAQELLSQYFGCSIVTFIPPGNEWTKNTEIFAYNSGAKYLSSYEHLAPTGEKSNNLTYIGNSRVIALHDRDVILNGIHWFENILKINSDKEIVTIREIGESLC